MFANLHAGGAHVSGNGVSHAFVDMQGNGHASSGNIPQAAAASNASRMDMHTRVPGYMLNEQQLASGGMYLLHSSQASDDEWIDPASQVSMQCVICLCLETFGAEYTRGSWSSVMAMPAITAHKMRAVPRHSCLLIPCCIMWSA
jgi:hypothetical protein